MAPRAFWKGYLKLSLVTCPVAMTPATTESEKVRLHILNAKTGNRVMGVFVDAETGERVDEDDQVKGYPRGESDHVLLEDEELDSVALESMRTIDIEMFVPADTVEWVWYDKPHYLVPNDKVGEEAFLVIREAMAATGTVGIARLVLYRRERAVMIEPRNKGIVLWTLRFGDEVRAETDYFSDIGGAGPKDEGPDEAAMKLMSRLIRERTTAWDPTIVGDPVQEKLLGIIAAKRKGRSRATKPKAESEAPRGNVVNIMDALEKSIASESGRKQR